MNSKITLPQIALLIGLILGLFQTRAEANAEQELSYEEFIACDLPSQQQACCCPKRLFVRHTEGRWIENVKRYTSFGLLGPMFSRACGSYTPMVDLRFHVLDRGKFASNAGVGVRYCNPCSSHSLSGLVYYDFRQGCFADFHQVGASLELLTRCLDIRFNGYFPIGPRWKHGKVRVFDDFIGDYLATCQPRQAAFTGVDLEVGRFLYRNCGCASFDLYGAFGTYYYNRKVCPTRDIFGAQARIAGSFWERLFCEVRGGYDWHNKWMFQSRITLSFPLGRENGRQCEPIRRQELIYLDCPQCCWTWNWDSPPR